MAIGRDRALDYFHSHDLIGLGMEADALRRKLHPEGVVTYVLDRNIHYTNFAAASSSRFCAVDGPFRAAPAGEECVLSLDLIDQKIAETVDMGGTGVLLRGNPRLPGLQIEWFERLVQGIKQRFPQLCLHCFSAPEILAIAESSELTVHDTLARLRDAGLDSIPGGGAAILDDEVRQRSGPSRCSAEDWAGVHRTAHRLGMRSTAAMTFGIGETFEQRVNHLRQIRAIQEETGGFSAFIPSSFPPGNTLLDPRQWQGATAIEYLKVLAISRLYLHNIENIQSSWAVQELASEGLAAQGLKVLELGLRFGGNDAGSAMLEGNGKAAGRANRVTEEDLRRVIRDAGFRPAQRDNLYSTFFLN